MKEPLSRIWGIIISILAIVAPIGTVVFVQKCTSVKEYRQDEEKKINSKLDKQEFEAFKVDNKENINKKSDRVECEARSNGIEGKLDIILDNEELLLKMHMHSLLLKKDTTKLQPIEPRPPFLCSHDGGVNLINCTQ
jgi:hypothetical protein